MGEMDGWQEWKYRTEFTFNGSGYEWVLTDATYSGQNTQMNRVVYYKLLVATVVGTAAYNMVKQHEDYNNGYVAWRFFCEWYDGGDVKNEAADYLRSNLEIYHLTLASDESKYINNVLSYIFDN